VYVLQKVAAAADEAVSAEAHASEEGLSQPKASCAKAARRMRERILNLGDLEVD